MLKSFIFLVLLALLGLPLLSASALHLCFALYAKQRLPEESREAYLPALSSKAGLLCIKQSLLQQRQAATSNYFSYCKADRVSFMLLIYFCFFI
jgi:hypothetical protein